jgi:LmbE family N-acetylglucosaminyl deacetylase
MEGCGFLDALADPARGMITGPVAVVVAHPDDETIGVGGQLARFSDVTIVHVTDGAPADMLDARTLGFMTRAAYARARREELMAAMAVLGIGAERLVALDLVDKTAMNHLADVARRLGAVFRERGIRTVLTHVYEGGHPDHDATAFAVQAAASRMDPPVAVIEMPYYRLGFATMRTQCLGVTRGRHTRTVRLKDEALAVKLQSLAAHRSQRRFLSAFDPQLEIFRLAGATDFTRPPNKGWILYERWGWGITAKDFAKRVAAAGVELRTWP